MIKSQTSQTTLLAVLLPFLASLLCFNGAFAQEDEGGEEDDPSRPGYPMPPPDDYGDEGEEEPLPPKEDPEEGDE